VSQQAVFADVRQAHFLRQSAALAIALGIPDEQAVRAVFPTPAVAVDLGGQAMQAGLTELAQAPYRDLAAALGTRTSAPSETTCTGHVTTGSIPDDVRFVRLQGTLDAQQPLGTTNGIAQVLDANDDLVGYAVLGQPSGAPGSPPPPVLGYVRADRAAGPLRLAGTTASCALWPSLVSGSAESPGS
jgi:hypothetical protein